MCLGLGLSDWSWELRLLLDAQKKKRGDTPKADSWESRAVKAVNHEGFATGFDVA